MVFCYKIITDTPRRSCSGSPRKKSPLPGIKASSSGSQLINSIDYDAYGSDILECIPERDWRLLATLARKRDADDEREELADQFRKLWQKEKEEREVVEAETNNQYQRYIAQKRREEQSWHEVKQQQKTLENQLKRRQLIKCIRHKERRSAYILASVDDQKTNDIIDKALEEEARAQLAADRRLRLCAAEELRKHYELIHIQNKTAHANKRRNELLRDNSQRLAISHALSTWEKALMRQEISAMEEARRAHHAAHAALTDARSVRLLRSRDAKRRRARRVAAVTQQMREFIRSGRRS